MLWVVVLTLPVTIIALAVAFGVFAALVHLLIAAGFLSAGS
jgi:hypothetical protein